jgi:hypothetical protein
VILKVFAEELLGSEDGAMRKAICFTCLNLALVGGVGFASMALGQTPQWLPAGPKTAGAKSDSDAGRQSSSLNHTVPATNMSRQSVLGEPYVTTCLVSVAENDIGMPSVTLTHKDELKSAIEQSCGRRISSVSVHLTDDKRATIQFTAPTVADAQRFWNVIQALPELLPYALDADVHLLESTPSARPDGLHISQ